MVYTQNHGAHFFNSSAQFVINDGGQTINIVEALPEIISLDDATID